MEAQEETSTLSQVNNEGQNKDTHSEVTSTNSKEHSDESRGTVSPVEGDAVEGGVGGGVGGSSNTATKKGKTSWKQPEKKNLSKEEKRANRDSWPSLEEAVTPPPETTTPPTPSPSSTSSTTPSSSLASPTSSSPTNSSNPLPSTSSSLLSTPPTSASPAFQSIPSTSSGSSSTSKRGKKGMNWVPFKDIGPPPSSHFKHSNNQNHNPNNLNSNTNSTHNNGRRRNNRDFNSDRSERNEKGDRPDRGERSDRGDRADRGERTDRAERGERDRERADRGDRGDRGERGHGDRNYRNNNFRHGRTRGRGYSNHYNNRQNAQYGSGSARVPLFTPQYFPKEDLKELITKQIEYYFSVENLCHDIFLRTHMDEEGWVAVTLIAQFPRILQLSSDQPLLIEAIKASQILELKDEKLRLTKDWQTWLIPKASALLSTPLIPSPTSNAVVETQHEVESTHVENTPSTASQAETAV